MLTFQRVAQNRFGLVAENLHYLVHYRRQRRRTTYAHCSSVSGRRIARHPPPLGRDMVGGLQFARKFAGAPFSISSVKNRLLRQRCDARDFTPLPIEILARRKVTPAFEPQRHRRAGSPNAKRGHDTGPERGPSLHVQGSVWRSCGSSLTLGTQAPDDRMEGFDPLLTFPINPVRAENARKRP